MLQGFIPGRLKSLLFSARLIAFTKKDGGVRPIAIGLTLRRLVAKLAVDQTMGVVKSSFQPVQLGVGVSRGLEAGIHAGRQFLNSLSPGHAMLKLDFANAFNTIRRDSLLECVSRVAPGIYPFVYATYAIETPLFYGSTVVGRGGPARRPIGPSFVQSCNSAAAHNMPAATEIWLLRRHHFGR